MRKFSDIENSGLAYVYEHWRPDTDVCFWVGKGTSFRYRVYKRGTNTHYNGIVAKLRAAGLDVEARFVAINLTDEEAFRVEVERMAFWRAQGVVLANKAIGGRGGMSGVTRSEESRAKQSAKTKGRKASPEQVAKIRERADSPEYKAFVSALHTGRKRPPETGQKISVGVKKSWDDPEIRASRIAGMKERPAISEETRAKMSAAQTPEKRVKISADVRERWKDPAFRQAAVEGMRRAAAARRSAHA